MHRHQRHSVQQQPLRLARGHRVPHARADSKAEFRVVPVAGPAAAVTHRPVHGDPRGGLFDGGAGVTARPQCALQDSSTGKKYCALICSPTAFIADQKAADAQCGANASCKSVQLGVGVCTYDD